MLHIYVGFVALETTVLIAPSVLTHVVGCVGVGVIIGTNKGVNPCDAAAVHPFTSVTVIEMTDGAAGITTFIDEVVSEVLHKYCVPPVPFKVTVLPIQAVKVPVIPAVGNGLTVILLDVEALQPRFVTVTVYKPAVVTSIEAMVEPVLHA